VLAAENGSRSERAVRGRLRGLAVEFFLVPANFVGLPYPEGSFLLLQVSGALLLEMVVMVEKLPGMGGGKGNGFLMRRDGGGGDGFIAMTLLGGDELIAA
jgi:hypothetical protein